MLKKFWNKIRAMLGLERSYKAYAYFTFRNSSWSKVVSKRKPKTESLSSDCVVGPFRSEIDCEEFCDHKNSQTIGYYGSYYKSSLTDKVSS